MKLKQTVHTLYIRKSELQTKNTVLFFGEVKARTWRRPTVIRRPKGWKGEWDNNAGVWVEYKAVGTFTVKEGRRRK